MKMIKVPFNGRGYKIQYTTEMIDTSMTSVPFFNVYAVFVDDAELQKVIGEHFTILYHPTATVLPLYDILTPGNVDEKNLKKEIAQQIMNDPSAG